VIKPIACVSALAFAGCSAPFGAASVAKPQALRFVPHASLGCAGTARTCIKHVVIVVQENRSFDNLFRSYPNAASSASGLSNCANVPSPSALAPLSLASGVDPDHYWGISLTAWDGGKMDGFCNNPSTAAIGRPAAPYSYVPNTRNEAGPYWSMARKYVIADHMFPTQFGESFSAHLTLIAGNDELSPHNDAIVDAPSDSDTGDWGCAAPAGTVTSYVSASRTYHHFEGPYPCFTQFHTIADSLDAAGISWKYYAPGLNNVGGQRWSAFSAIKRVYEGSDWKNVVTPPKTVLTDIATCTASACAFPQVSWIVPSPQDSDHGATNHGPSWVASIVNSLYKNKQLWPSTAIFVLWDDWGGWYDDVPPPQPSPWGSFGAGDYRGLGIRVPCIIISPFTFNLAAKGRNVTHTQYEFGSILKFIEEVYGLPTVGSAADGYTDGRASSITDAFDFSQNPKAGAEIEAPYPPKFFLKEAATATAPDKE
jgi:phospholipase C